RHRAPGHHAVEREEGAGEDVAAAGATVRPDRLARPLHVRRVGAVADHLEGEIGLHTGADVKIAVMKQWPAAMRTLDAAQIGRDLGLKRRIGRQPEVMLEQHVLGRDGRVGFELEYPMAVPLLAGEQRRRRTFDRLVKTLQVHARVAAVLWWQKRGAARQIMTSPRPIPRPGCPNERPPRWWPASGLQSSHPPAR